LSAGTPVALFGAMKRMIFLSLALFAVTACGKDSKSKDTDKDKGSSAAGGTKEKEKPTDPPAAGPFKTDPKALFAEFGENSGADPMALIDKYKNGATFSGVITTGPGDAMPNAAMMDVDGKNHIMMDFTDAASIKDVKAGDTITATCQIGGEMDTMMQVSDCVLVK
jgi:hypothetical protein